MEVFIPAPYGTQKRREQDLEMMKTPDRWPIWPRLPLKNPETDAHGYLANTSTTDNTVEPKIFTHYIFEAHNSDDFIQFDSLEAIVEAGWTVD